MSINLICNLIEKKNLIYLNWVKSEWIQLFVYLYNIIIKAGIWMPKKISKNAKMTRNI